MNKKLFLAVTLLLIGFAPKVWAYDFSAKCESGQTLYYNITSYDEFTIEVTSEIEGNDDNGYSFYSTPMEGNLRIPEKVSYNNIQFSVTGIGDFAFSFCGDLTSVNIPYSITSIGTAAFISCYNLTSIVIPSSVIYVGDLAFSYCNKLTSINIPHSVTYIGEKAFSNCDNLTSITLKSSVPVYDTKLRFVKDGIKYAVLDKNSVEIMLNIFDDPEAGTVIECPDKPELVIPEKVTAGNTFTVTSIDQFAFYGCEGLTSVTIPNSVTSIGDSAFYSCSNLTSVTLPNSITSIGNGTFFNCKNLLSVNIPNSVTSINDAAFGGCSSLTTITIPNSVEYIGWSAFFGCTNLASIAIPKSVTEIANTAFMGCQGLNSITVDSGNPIYDSRNNCNAIVETSTNAIVTGCKNTVIPSSITSINAFAFAIAGPDMTSIIIPSSVTVIEDWAFVGCVNLSVEIPGSVKIIGKGAFAECNKLDSKTVKKINKINPKALVTE